MAVLFMDSHLLSRWELTALRAVSFDWWCCWELRLCCFDCNVVCTSHYASNSMSAFIRNAHDALFTFSMPGEAIVLLFFNLMDCSKVAMLSPLS